MPSTILTPRSAGPDLRYMPRWACALVVCGIAGLDSCGGSSKAPADFEITFDSATATAVEGGATAVDYVYITGLNGFDGSASVQLTGLPPGTTSDLDSPTAIRAWVCD